MKVAKVDATAQTKLASRFGVSGYPTLKFFPAGLTSDSEVVDYNGARDASSLIRYPLYHLTIKKLGKRVGR